MFRQVMAIGPRYTDGGIDDIIKAIVKAEVKKGVVKVWTAEILLKYYQAI